MNEESGTNKRKGRISDSRLLWGGALLGFAVLLGAWFVFVGGDNSFFDSARNREAGGQEAAPNSSVAGALQEAVVRLTVLQERMETEEISESMVEEVRDIREDLASAYQGTSSEVKEMWRQFDRDLEEFEQSLHATTGEGDAS